MIEPYPAYMDDFARLESIAPPADLPVLKFLTEHETVTIEFANAEQAGRADSTKSLERYLASTPPQVG